MTISAPNTIIPITQTVINADSSNYKLNPNGTLNIMSGGIYHINATVHGVINTNDYITSYVQAGVNAFYSTVSNASTLGQQFMTTFGGYIETTTAINIVLAATSSAGRCDIFGTALSTATYITITQIK